MRVQIVVSMFLILALASPRLILDVQALPAAILRVSLPAGTVVGPDSDPWLSEGWLSSLEGETQTFVVRIEDVSASQRSYDTSLVIALNDAGYNNLVSLLVNGTVVSKTAFRHGAPTPYNIWTWPSGDVYPTWFNDTIVNVGTIRRKWFKEVIVSVTFSNVTGVRMHFDAWGKRKVGSPKSDGDITHNPSSADSTVLFEPGQPQPQPPYAEFSFTLIFPEVGEIVTFNASSSYDPDGTIVDYTWDFGDDTPPVTESDPITTHSYAALGDYEVTLTVADNDGLNGTVSDVVHVCEPPVASFVFSPTDPLENEEVTFDASSSTSDGGVIIGYTWDFGDGSPQVTEGDPITNHTYNTYGIYTITLNVTDSEGKWDTESKQITVERLPVADFTWSPVYPEVYEIVTFDASYSTPDGGVIVSYEWDFGDGTLNVIEPDPITTHHYTSAGNYTVTLNVTDSEDRWDTESKIITVIGSPSPEAVLHLSLPDGTYVGPNLTDPWLDECWLLNIAGLSGTFTLNITDVSGSITSYDTHLIIALNEESYNNLVSLNVNGTDVPKTAFKYGTPTPYNKWTWPSGDIYPTWFNDTLVNAGDIPPKGYVELTVSVTFSNVSGVRMHFDAYGSKVSPPPPSVPGQITRNPCSADSTVLFWPPPIVEYYLTVGTDPEDITTILGEGWYDNCTYVNLTAPLYVPDEAGVDGERYMFTQWTVDGDPEAGNPITVHMNANHTAIAHYVKQYYLTVISPYDTPGGMGWYNSSDTAYAKLDTGVVDHENGTRRVFTHWSVNGNAWGTSYAQSDQIIMDAPKTAIANWKTEHQLTVRTSGLGTYVTYVYNGITTLGTATDATPYTGWFEEGSLILLDIDSPIIDGSKRFVFTHWSGDATGTVRPASVSMSTAKDITANYKTQYKVTVTASPSGALGGTFNVTYTQCGTTYTDVQKTTPWNEWVDASTTVTVSEPQGIISGYKFDHYDPSASVTMDNAKSITLIYAQIEPLSVSISPTTANIKIGESITFTSTVSGGVPDYHYQWYLNGSAVPDATSPAWTFTPETTGFYTVYLIVTDNLEDTAKSNEASVTVAPQLTVSISPTSASILVGQSVEFTSTVSGGYSPYSYQWYLNGDPVSGANSPSWTFTPTSSGIYYVYLKVTDANDNTAQSETARVTVGAVPVGGYSVSLTKPVAKAPLICYTMILAMFGALITLIKRKRK